MWTFSTYTIDNPPDDGPAAPGRNDFVDANEIVVGSPQEGVDTMTRNMQKKLADAQEFAKKLDKLDRTQLIYTLGEVTYRLKRLDTPKTSA